MNRVANKRSEILRLLQEPLGKRIDQNSVEKCISQLWHIAPKTSTTAARSGLPFVMMFPPPNITGNLHLGHALTATIQDALIRHRRMTGKQVVWIPGFDHAGLATQIVVEGVLWRREQLIRQQVGRDRLVSLANDWKDQKRSEMRGQLDRLALLLDRDREYFTMDHNSSLAVSAAFKQLFKNGVIYRSVKEVYWSNKLSTTLSDIEVETIDGEKIYARTGEKVDRRPISQWFIDAKQIAHQAVDAVEQGQIEIIPPNYKRVWSTWLVENGVQDWCISRQGWWGHQIPAFKLKSSADVTENWIMADNAQEAAEKLCSGQDNVIQDHDVLDTWFSSSLLPLTVSGWPNERLFEQSCRSGHFPLSLMETGFDILTHWVSKMAMMSLALTNRVPFRTVLLHGMICDSHGKKMSKSKGNVIDPLDVIDGASLTDLMNRTKDMAEQGVLDNENLKQALKNQQELFPKGIPVCGADGLRAYLLSHDVQEEVVKIQIGQIDKVRRLANKIWNIYRFLLPLISESGSCFKQVLNYNIEASLNKGNLDELDLALLRLQAKCVFLAHEAFNKTYQLQHCFNELELFWSIHLSNEYLVKHRTTLMYKDSQADLKAQRDSKLQVASTCLLTSTKLLYPFMPHLSEFLYQKLVMAINGNDDSTNAGEIECLIGNESFPQVEEWSEFLIKC